MNIKYSKTEIIEISEQKFGNRLNTLEKNIIATITKIDIKTDSLKNELNSKVEALDSKTASLKTEINSLKTEMRWLIGILFTVLTTMMALFKFIK